MGRSRPAGRRTRRIHVLPRSSQSRLRRAAKVMSTFLWRTPRPDFSGRGLYRCRGGAEAQYRAQVVQASRVRYPSRRTDAGSAWQAVAMAHAFTRARPSRWPVGAGNLDGAWREVRSQGVRGREGMEGPGSGRGPGDVRRVRPVRGALRGSGLFCVGKFLVGERPIRFSIQPALQLCPARALAPFKCLRAVWLSA